MKTLAALFNLPLVLAMLVAPAARAEVGFGVSAGVRSLEMGLMLSNTRYQAARGSEANLNAYFTPGKSLPLGISLGVDKQSYELNKDRQFFDHLDVTEVDAGIVLLPPGGKTRPMLRLGYTFYGLAAASTSGPSAGTLGHTAVAQQGESSWRMGVTGTHFALGTQIELGKGALLSAGLDFGQTKAKLSHVNLDGADQTAPTQAAGLRSFRMQSTAVLCGGEVAL